MERKSLFLAEMSLNQIPHHSRLGATSSLRLVPQQLDVSPIHFERHYFHGRTVLPNCQNVNTKN
jgi:hypothetical protein